MATKLIEIYEAVWSALDNYSALTRFLAAYGGHTYKYSADGKLGHDLSKADLPALVVSPVELGEEAGLSGYTVGRLRLAVETRVSQRDLDVLLDFVWHVGAALKEKLRGSDANFGLSYVAKVELGGVRFEGPDSAEGYRQGRVWSATRTITVDYHDATPA